MHRTSAVPGWILGFSMSHSAVACQADELYAALDRLRGEDLIDVDREEMVDFSTSSRETWAPRGAFGACQLQPRPTDILALATQAMQYAIPGLDPLQAIGHSPRHARRVALAVQGLRPGEYVLAGMAVAAQTPSPPDHQFCAPNLRSGERPEAAHSEPSARAVVVTESDRSLLVRSRAWLRVASAAHTVPVLGSCPH
jgi:hypothetical protein